MAASGCWTVGCRGEDAALRWLARVGLQDRADHRTFELSIGQQQCVAVARSLVIEPDIVLADEPIAEMDGESADVILSALAEVAVRGGEVVAAAHNAAALTYASRVVLLRDESVQSAGTPDGLSSLLRM